MASPSKITIRGGSDFNDPAYFQPKVYLKLFYSKPDFFQVIHNRWSDTFAADRINGEKFLDFGCGPSIHIAMAASRSFREIYLAEYAEQSRQVVQEWKDGKSTHDWTPLFKHAAQREGDGISWKDVENRLRMKIKDITPCDTTKDDILGGHHAAPFDCIGTSLCLDDSCKDEEVYSTAIKKLAGLLKPGGYLLKVGALGGTYYTIAEEKFYCLFLTKEVVEASFAKAGFQDVVMEVFPDEEFDPSFSDVKGFFFLKARK